MEVYAQSLGHLLQQPRCFNKSSLADALYWKTSMVSPVRFTKALKELLTKDLPGLLVYCELWPGLFPRFLRLSLIMAMSHTALQGLVE